MQPESHLPANYLCTVGLLGCKSHLPAETRDKVGLKTDHGKANGKWCAHADADRVGPLRDGRRRRHR